MSILIAEKGTNKAWNRMSGLYDRFMKKDKKLYGELEERILSKVEAEEKLLEIGTATGIISLRLGKKIRAITAIDYSEKMIAIAKRKAKELGNNRIVFEVGNAYELAYEDNSFDCVVIANVLHIMPAPEKAIKEIKRVTKPGGLVFAPTFVHAKVKKAAIFTKLAGLLGFKAYSEWTLEGYKEFLEKNGLKVVQVDVIMASFPEAYVVCKVDG